MRCPFLFDNTILNANCMGGYKYTNTEIDKYYATVKTTAVSNGVVVRGATPGLSDL